MGADMIVTMMALPNGKTPDYAAGKKFLDELVIDEAALDDLVDWGYVDQDDEDFFTEDGQIKAEPIRAWMHGCLTELEEALDHRYRYVAWVSIRELDVAIAGGLSWGDDTDEGRVMTWSGLIDGLQQSMGFVEWWTHDPCHNPDCREHGIAASNRAQSEFYEQHPRVDAVD